MDGLSRQLDELWDDSGSPDGINLSSTHKKSWHCARCGHMYMCIPATLLKSYKRTGNACPVCTGMLLSPGYNDLATMHPDVADRLAPGQDAGSILGTKRTALMFICDKGHEYHATIKRMLEDGSCPICRSGGYVSEHGDIVCDWDAGRNSDDPSEVTCGSPRKEHWLCHVCGTTWCCTVYARVHLGRGCPSCTSTSEKLSDFKRRHYAGLHPFSACPASKYWDAERNDIPLSMQSAGSPDRRWFVCGNGHHVMREVRAVAKRGFTCDMCISDPVSGHADMMEYWDDGRDPSTTPMGYSGKIAWKCPTCGYVFMSRASTLRHRMDRNEDACPACGLRILVRGFNDFATRQPKLTGELLDPSSASGFMENSIKQMRWVCDRNTDHIYSTTPRQRVMNGVGCKICMAMDRGNRRRIALLESNPVPDWIREYADDDSRAIIDSEGVSAGDCRQAITITYPDCGHDRKTSIYNMIRSPECPVCSKGSRTSKGQEQVFEYVKSILPEGETAEYNHRICGDGRRELDIYVPSRHLGIEYNGLFWHNECHAGKRSAMDKVRTCRDNGIMLLTVWEDDWIYRRNVVKDMIATKLGLFKGKVTYARKCTVESCISSDLDTFMDLHHIQGNGTGSVCLRLTSGGDTVAAMICGMSDHGRRMTIERYATDGLVPGGFTRLLHHAIESAKPETVVTFSDNSCSDGSLYEQCGFTAEAALPPDYSYVVNGMRRHKFGYRKSRFMRDPNLEYHEGMTERQLADMNGLYRVYDAGKVRWVLHPSTVSDGKGR